jgi:hypothetical protein
MNAVFFPEIFSERAPTLMGHLCAAPNNEWITLVDVLEHLQAGHSVEIRQASPAELKRADGYIALYEIGQMLGDKMRELLDEEPPEEIERKINAVADALHAIDCPGRLDAQE